MYFMTLKTLTLGLIVGLSASIQVHAQTPVTPVAQVDLERYLGTWYEIAALPQFFQRKCVADTQAFYKRAEAPNEKGLIQVSNSCTNEDKGKELAEGRARYKEGGTSAQLEVTFLKLFGAHRFWAGGDYWVIGLGENVNGAASDYAWAIVGHPTRKYGWVLSRTAALPTLEREKILKTLKDQGYDPCFFIVTPQSGGEPSKKPFC